VKGFEITGLSWHPQKTCVIYCDNQGYFGEWSDIIDTPVPRNVNIFYLSLKF